MTPSAEPRTPLPQLGRLTLRVLPLLGVAVSALLLVHFHDQYWYPHDEGIYAHIAERIAHGEVLHRDIQDIHPGYGAFVSAIAMRLFGSSFVAMRYPLVLVGLITAILAAALLRKRGPTVMALGAVIATCLGWPLFLGPSPAWYTAPLFLGAPLVLEDRSRLAAWRLVTAGAFVGTAFLFRQLNGVILGVAVAAWVLGGSARRGAAMQGACGLSISRMLLLVILAGTVAYTVMATDTVGWALFGIGPVMALGLALIAPPLPSREALRRSGWCGLGLVVGMSPMLLYLTATGNWSPFVADVFDAALALPSMEYFEGRSYANLLVLAVLAIGQLKVGIFLAGLFWAWLLLAPLALTYRVGLDAAGGLSERGPKALVVFALSSAILAVHYPSTLYLSGAATLATLAWLSLTRIRPSLLAGLIAVLVVYVWVWQGGRSPFVWGRRIVQNQTWAHPKVGLKMDPSISREYDSLIASLRESVKPGEPIFAFPAHAEIYFLLGSPNPTRFYSLAQAGLDADGIRDLLRRFEDQPPRVLIYDPYDPLHVPEAIEIARWASRRAERIEQVHGLFLYFLPRPAGSGRQF